MKTMSNDTKPKRTRIVAVLTLQKFLKIHDIAVEQKSIRRALRNKFRNTDTHEHNTRWQFNAGSDVHKFLCDKFNVAVKKIA